jgi:hypothetical protein
LYKQGYSSSNRVHKEMVNEIANLAFLTKEANIKISASDPLAYLATVQETYPGALEAQFVPMDESLWTVEKFPEFLAARRELIADGINVFMDELLAEPEASETTIEDLIKHGESETIEYKSSLRWDYKQGNTSKVVQKSVAKTLAAFLNGQGGTLVIGLKDDGEVLGLENDLKTLGSKPDLDGWQLSFSQMLTNYLGADIAAVAELDFAEVEGKTIAVASCQAHGQPVFMEDADNVEFWVRTGNSSRALNVLETSKYIQQRWPSGASAEPVAA